MYVCGTGILTSFPFVIPIRDTLGPTNPQLTNIVEEPLSFRWQGFSPCFAATTGRILIPARSTISQKIASPLAGRLST